MKKIAFIYCDMNVGGVQRVTSVITNYLVDKTDYEINILTHYSGSSFEMNAAHIVMNPKIVGKIKTRFRQYFNKHICKWKYPHQYLNGDKTKIITQKIRENNYDVVVLIAEEIFYAKRIKEMFPDLRVIGWMHNDAKVYLNQYFKDSFVDFTVGLRSCDTLLCLTYSDLQEFKEYNPSTRVMYNPLTVFHSMKSKKERKIISWVGRISIEHKGIDLLVEVAKKIPEEWKIHVAGLGENKKFDGLIAEAGVEDKIVRKGALEGENLLNHYADSSLYLSTSRWEGFPLVLAEAMSFGLPVISFFNNGSNEVLEGGKWGCLVENSNVEKMVESINTIINDKELIIKYSNLSQKRVEDFKLEQIGSQWIDLLSSE